MIPEREIPATHNSQTVSFAALAGILVGSTPWIILCAVIALAVSVAVASLELRHYTSRVSFIPQGGKAAGLGGGLAAQLGLGSIGGDAGQSPAFYVDLLGTREILRRVATSQFSMRDKSGYRQGPLARMLGLDHPESPEALDESIDYLRKALHAGLSQLTGVVGVNVTTDNQALSAQIASRVLEALDGFNRENARAQATQQRDFTQQRLNEFRDELRVAEANLQENLQRNRDAATSSEAAFQRERLAREVGLRQQLYVTVTQAFEQARMEEARDAPQITIIERSEIPHRADPRGFIQKGILGALLGALFAVFAIILREIFSRARQHQAAWYAEWDAALKKAAKPSKLAKKSPTVSHDTGAEMF